MAKRHIDQPAPGSEIILYQTEDGRNRIEVRLENETVWLTQQLMAELFQTTKQNIGQHLKNVFVEGELQQDSVVKKSFTTAADGKQYETLFYNLDAIISVGYLDFAERQAERQAPMTMHDWAEHLDKILTASGERLLADAKSYNKGKPIRIEEFEPERAWWGDEADGFKARVENERAWRLSLDTIKAGNFNLDLKNPHNADEGPGDADHLLPEYEKLLAQIAETRGQLKAQLMEALGKV